MPSSAAARTPSAPIRTGRLRWRSTQPPPNQANSARGSVSVTASKPRSSAPAPATRMAARGKAVRVIREPTAEMPCALHNSRKSRCRHRPLAAGRSGRASRSLRASIDNADVCGGEPVAQLREQPFVGIDAPRFGQLDLAADARVTVLDDDAAAAIAERTEQSSEPLRVGTPVD